MSKIIFFILLASVQYLSAQTGSDEMIALEYFQNGEYDKALVYYEKLYRKNPGIYYYDYYFKCLINTEQYDKAEKLVSDLTRKNPEIFRYSIDLGYIYQLKGDQSKAEKQYQSTIQKIRPTEENYIALAQYFIFLGAIDWAIRTYEAAVNKQIAGTQTKLQLSFYYFQQNRFQDLFQLLYAMLDLNELQLAGLQQRLQAYFAQDKTSAIISEFTNFALRQAQKNPQNFDYGQMLLWAYLQQNEFDKAMNYAIALDRRFKTEGQIILDLAQVFMNNKQYDILQVGLEYILKQGEKNVNYNLARSYMLNLRYEKATSKVPYDIQEIQTLEKELITFINESGIHQNSIHLVEKLASIQAFYLDKPADAITWLERAIQNPSLSRTQIAILKLLLADVMLMNGQHWDASLLYAQVEKEFKHDTLGAHAKFKNARFFYYIGEIQYALSQLQILSGATSKLIANDAIEMTLFIKNNIDYDSSLVPITYYAQADFLNARKKPLDALIKLDSLLILFPNHPIADDAHFLMAKIFLQMENYDKAINHLQKIVDYFAWDLLADDALYLLAHIYADLLNDPEKARSYLWTIIEQYPSSIYVNEAKQKYQQLRSQQIP